MLAQVLKEEDIGVWAPGEPTGNYSHVNWAMKVMHFALEMGDNAGFLIKYALEGIPHMLKDHMTCSYTSWTEFVDNVEKVPAVKLKRAKEELDKNQMQDTGIMQLKVQNASAVMVLPFQFSQLSMDNNRSVQPLYQTPCTYTANNPFLQVPTAPAPISRPTCGIGLSPMGWRGSPLAQVPLTRVQIMEKLSMVPQ
jgi:hypothetical protein